MSLHIMMSALKVAFFFEPFSLILQDVHPDLFIYDVLQPWNLRVAYTLSNPTGVA